MLPTFLYDCVTVGKTVTHIVQWSFWKAFRKQSEISAQAPRTQAALHVLAWSPQGSLPPRPRPRVFFCDFDSCSFYYLDFNPDFYIYVPVQFFLFSILIQYHLLFSLSGQEVVAFTLYWRIFTLVFFLLQRNICIFEIHYMFFLVTVCYFCQNCFPYLCA